MTARHAVDSEGAAVRALWVDPQGVALADPATGEVTRISSASVARRPDVAVSTAATTVTASRETDAGVEVWRGASVVTIADASAPSLEKQGSDREVLFYTKADADGGTGWSLYTRRLE